MLSSPIRSLTPERMRWVGHNPLVRQGRWVSKRTLKRIVERDNIQLDDLAADLKQCIPCDLASMPANTWRAAVKAPLEPDVVIYCTDGTACRTPDMNGNRVVIIFMDYRSHFAWAFLRRNNADLTKALDASITLFGQPNRVHTDNAAMYNSSGWLTLCNERNILPTTTASSTPQQNSLIESLIRWLWRKTRVLLKDAQLPDEFWGYAMSHAILLRAPEVPGNNRTAAFLGPRSPRRSSWPSVLRLTPRSFMTDTPSSQTSCSRREETTKCSLSGKRI